MRLYHRSAGERKLRAAGLIHNDAGSSLLIHTAASARLVEQRTKPETVLNGFPYQPSQVRRAKAPA